MNKVDELYKKFIREYAVSVPPPKSDKNEARLLDAVKAGEDITAIKAFTADEVPHLPGDIIKAEEYKSWEHKAGSLARHQFIIPAKDYDSAVNSRKLLDYRAKIDEAYSRLSQARSYRSRCQEELNAIEGAYSSARIALDDARAQESGIEQEALSVIGGVDIAKLDLE